MVKGYQERHLIDFVLRAISGLGKPMRALVPQRLRNAIVKNPDPNSRREDHCEVLDIPKLGLSIVSAEPYMTIPPGDVEDEEDGNGLGDNYEP